MVLVLDRDFSATRKTDKKCKHLSNFPAATNTEDTPLLKIYSRP
jgi:hypothetical protein